jgi:hypothetical protein
MTIASMVMEPAEYCRELETYLCRKNEGHLIRIAGPVFEQVCGWAAQGVPLKIAFRGIDRYCERYYARGPRRRPVQIQFCEADILELFDAWRRAVGVGVVAADQDAPPIAAAPTPRKPALAAHIDRAIARLTALRVRGNRAVSLEGAIASAVRSLDELGASARGARGNERSRILARLSEIDRELTEAAAGTIDEATASELRREAEAELAPFGSRMAPDARSRAAAAAFERLVRETLGIPAIAYE